MSGDIEYKKSNHVGHNIYGAYNAAPQSSLEKAIGTILEAMGEDEALEEFIEELSEYITDHPDRKIIGLENKLKQGDRADLLHNAVRLKNKFERKLAKGQMSLVEQRVYIQVLATINTAFNQKVRPLILEGKEKSEVDQTIHKSIIEPVHSALVGFDIGITSEHVSGMLYFLTGKCHLLWSQ